ncbi:MAG: CoA-binding protein [Ignavibacteria bacterium]|nr:CoA-binding protein [Ignavibacteria bacterium]
MTIEQILSNYKNIAVYGMSTNPAKAAYHVPKYMLGNGYNVIPINPMADEIDGRKCYHNLADVPDEIDILDVFRPSEQCLAVVEEAVQRKAAHGDIKVIWLQLGIVSDEAAALAAKHNIEFVQDKCIKVEHQRI